VSGRPESLREQAAAVRSGVVSPLELVDRALSRIAATDDRLHAWVVVDADGARAAARESADRLASGDAPGPLFGVPVAIKDIIDVQGIPSRCGSPLFDEAQPARRDSDVVRRLRQAGAIILGKTVTQEFAAGVLSPPARNPWNPERVPGGSSGGSAAAVTAGVVAMGMGSDTGGSIRIPAAACGCCGFKPSYGTLSVEGVQALAPSLDTLGPLGATVDDVRLAWDALRDPGSEMRRPASIGDLSGLRLAAPRRHFRNRLQEGVAAAFDAAIETLRGLGATIVEDDWEDAVAARASGYVINRVETGTALWPLVEGEQDRLSLLNPDLQLRVQAGRLVPAHGYLTALRERERVRDSMARWFAGLRLDGVIAPALPATAIRAGTTTARFSDGDEPIGIAWTRLTMPFNATGQPVLSLPCGFDGDGLPVGMQIAGHPGREDHLFAIGEVYEQAAGWHSRRPVVDARKEA
jgi:aspartyl-tRNA(Asn)/glutamyl-tRNA(Gln) amidotransferase subunit A